MLPSARSRVGLQAHGHRGAVGRLDEQRRLLGLDLDAGVARRRPCRGPSTSSPSGSTTSTCELEARARVRGPDRPQPSGRIPTTRRRRAPRSARTPGRRLDVARRARPLQQVHRRRPDEPGDEHVGRVVVDLLRRAELLQPARRHHRDPVAERHRLDLVVRDVDRRDAEPLVQPLQLGAHLHPELRVEVRQRLVQQEHLRLAHERPAHRHALPLPAGQLPGAPPQQLFQPEHLCHRVRPAARARPSGSCAGAARTRGSSPPSCAGRARSSGTPSRCRGPCGGMSLITPPPTAIVPALIFSRPATIRSAVVLPQPDGPTRIRNSPSPTSNDRSSTATIGPGNTFVTWSKTTSVIWSALQPLRRDPAHEVPLRRDEQDQHRQHAHHVAGHQQVRVVHVGTLEAHQPELQRER